MTIRRSIECTCRDDPERPGAGQQSGSVHRTAGITTTVIDRSPLTASEFATRCGCTLLDRRIDGVTRLVAAGSYADALVSAQSLLTAPAPTPEGQAKVHRVVAECLRLGGAPALAMRHARLGLFADDTTGTVQSEKDGFRPLADGPAAATKPLPPAWTGPMWRWPVERRRCG